MTPTALAARPDAPSAPSAKWAWPGYVLFFLMLFLPTTYKTIKVVCIVAVLAIVGADVYRRRGRMAIDARVFFWTWFMTLVGLFFVLLGVVRGHPGAMPLSTVYVVWPWLYLVFVAGISHEAIVRGLLRVMGWSLLAIDVYALHYILYSAGIWPAGLYLELDLGQAISFFEGSIEFNLYNISSLLFLIPFAVAALMVWPSRRASGDEGSPPIRRGLLWATVLLGVVVALLSGRRALLLCVALTPAVVFPLQLLTPASERRFGTRQALYALAGFVAVIGAGLVYLTLSFDVSLAGVWSMFAEGFDFAYDSSATLRSDQFAGLMAAWAEVPLFGSGLGATAEQAARINEAPWSYELQYAALLYHTGLVGFLLYTSGVVWIYAMGVRVIRTHARYRRYMIPVLVGLTSFLIANATNQYLATYYYVWVLFLPVAIVNLYLMEASLPAVRRPHGESPS